MILASRSREDWIEQTASMAESGPSIRGAQFYDTGFEFWWRLGKPEGTVLDVGCGHGRLAVPLVDLPVRYLGLDINPELTAWSNAAFDPWGDRIKFETLDVANSHYRPVGKAAELVKFPCADSSVDVGIAMSLFTHIERISALEAYLVEFFRVLKNGGKLVCSFFFSPPNKPHSGADRTVFDRFQVLGAIRAAEFWIQSETGGLTEGWHDQADLVLVKDAA